MAKKGSSTVGLRFVFHAAEVSKPLLSVKRITECGNRVHFGPSANESYIQNVSTGDKVFLRETPSGSYVLDAILQKTGSTEITIDSGAEDNVCPPHWAPEFPCITTGLKRAFRGADGNPIPHYGSKNVTVVSPF